MTPNEYAEVLADVSAMVFEEATFVFTEPAEDEPQWDGNVVEVQLDYSGDGNGTLMLAAPESLGNELAANLLGVDEGDVTSLDRPAEAALSEMLNMIAGPLTASWLGEEAVCKIGVPEAKTVPGTSHRGLSNAGTCAVSLVTEEDQPIELAAVIR